MRPARGERCLVVVGALRRCRTGRGVVPGQGAGGALRALVTETLRLAEDAVCTPARRRVIWPMPGVMFCCTGRGAA